jgi:hypothetical protein
MEGLYSTHDKRKEKKNAKMIVFKREQYCSSIVPKGKDVLLIKLD